MGFISRVHERLKSVEKYSVFKDLLAAYQTVSQVGVPRPKLYLSLTRQDIRDLDWANISRRVPNIFVIRPNIFLNASHDYFLRDDGSHLLMNFTTGTQQTRMATLEQQVKNLERFPASARLLFEEFPLTASNTLHYPAHYRVHAFHDTIGMIQVSTPDNVFWMDVTGQILDFTNDKDVSHLVPETKTLEDLRAAAKTISIVTELPYIRIDFVLSTRGALFRSLACIPGDVRSEAFAWLYSKHDETMETLWTQAEDKIKIRKNNRVVKPQHDNSQRPNQTNITTPDDNA